MKITKDRKCPHVPHNPDTMQTVCELCGAEIFNDPKTGLWNKQTTSEKQMKNYRVEWVIDITAEGPIGAARQAHAMQQDPQSMATVFEVYEEDGEPPQRRRPVAGDPGDGESIHVDLTAIDEAGETLNRALGNADTMPDA